MLRPDKRQADTWAVVAAVLLSVFCLLATLYIAGRRLPWYDEIITAIVSRLSWPGEVLRLLKTGVDQQPLPYYLLVKLSGGMFGVNLFSARLPSALALFAALLITFDCARRLTDGLHGLLALSLLLCSKLMYYGFEARPYALVCMWSAGSIWLWLHTRRDSTGAAALFGLTVAGSITAHYYAVFCLIPYAVATLFEIREKGLPRKMVAGCVGAAVGVSFILPVVSALRGLSGDFWARASLPALDEVFVSLFPHFLVYFALILVWIAFVDVSLPGAAPAPPMTPSERLAWLFLLIPIVGFLAAKIVGIAFYHRYFIGMLPGVAIGFSCLMWRHFRYRILVPAGTLCVLAGAGILLCASHVIHPEQIPPPQPAGSADESAKIATLLRSESVLFAEGKQFVVVPVGSVLTPEALYLSPHPERYRVLDDPGLPVEPLARLHKRLGDYIPMRIWTVNDLKEHAREAAVTGFTDPALRSMEEMGLSFHFRLVDPLKVMYLN
jgi:hypothetical protein